MTDYNKLIDQEIWQFINRSNSFYPPETISFTLEEQRKVYASLCKAFHQPYPEGVTANDFTIDHGDYAVPVRQYDHNIEGRAADAVILYFHGGGFVLGGLESHDDICAELCAGTQYRVISVDYRLAPEHPFPTGFLDSVAVFEWVADNCDLPIILCGDSAGGNLAAAIAHHTRLHRRAPVKQVLIYPALGGDDTQGSYITHAQAPMLTTSELAHHRDVYANGCDVLDKVSFAPLSDNNFSDLPQTIAFSAQCDPLADDGRDYCDKILADGGQSQWINEVGLVHGYLRARHSSQRARDSFSAIIVALKLDK